jgi:hypothetical protein
MLFGYTMPTERITGAVKKTIGDQFVPTTDNNRDP